nr:uncharacterized protein LOC124812140 [Hydra vulgaris]
MLEYGKPLGINCGKPTLPLIRKNSDIISYIGKKSWLIFLNLKDDGKWLKIPSSEWDDNAYYLKMKLFIKTLKVTNDAAERGIKLCSDYLQILTKDEAVRNEVF